METADANLPPTTVPVEQLEEGLQAGGALAAADGVHTWLRLDPELTQAVLAKTEEELLGGLAALMRNKVEAERAARRLAQLLSETNAAQRELERLRQRIRQTEDELANRQGEVALAGEQVAQTQAAVHARTVAAEEAALAATREAHLRLQAEVDVLSAELATRLVAREALIEQVTILEAHHRRVTAAVADGAGAEAAFEHLSARAEELRRETRRLEAELANLRAACVASRQERDEVRAEAAAAVVTVEETLRTLQAADAERARLGGETAAHVSEQGALAREAEFEEVRRKHDELQTVCDARERDLQKLRASLDEAQRELRTAVAAREQLSTAEAEKRAELDQLHQRIALAHLQLGDLGKERDALTEEAEVARQALIDLQEKQRYFARDLADKTQQQEALSENLTKLQAHHHAQTRDAQAVTAPAEAEGADLDLEFAASVPPIATGYDGYPLESVFFTEESLDADKVADLVSHLPGIDGCLIVRKGGPVLSSRLAEHFYEHLRVPGRDYQLLFERLPNRRDDERLPEWRHATHQLENGFLTVTQAGDMFVLASSTEPRLKPGVDRRLGVVARELSKMYP